MNHAAALTGFLLLATWPAAAVDLALQTNADGSPWSPVAPGLITVPAGPVHFRAVLSAPGSGSTIATSVVSESFPATGGAVHLILDRSDDLEVWFVVPSGSQVPDPKAFFRARTSAAMSLIPAGTFTMGSPESEPGRDVDEVQHTVTLTRNFYMQQTEVTWDQWNEVRDWGLANGYTDIEVGQSGDEGDASGLHPVTAVSWQGVVKWLNAWSEMNGLAPCYTLDGEILRTGIDEPVCDFDASGFRLPTEAEWEYACRASSTTAFYNGPITVVGNVPVDPNLDLIGWYLGNSDVDTQPVATKLPNPYGLYDMAGNLWEWCWDWYDDYGAGPATDPTGPSSGSDRIVRGGDFQSLALNCRSSYRNYSEPLPPIYILGFRPVRTAAP